VYRGSAVLLLACLWGPIRMPAQERFHAEEAPVSINRPGAANSARCGIIYLGFVGALEPANNKYSGVVQIRKTLEGKAYADVCANSFSPYAWTEGRAWLLKHFPSHPGQLTPEELQHLPKVILVGHSMGGWAMLSVARELRSRDIPVELTIQVDSVGLTDYTVPKNVKSAAIFHANDVLMFMTTKHVRREDPAYTKLVANVTVAGAGHESITRDPRIRALVMDTVENLRAISADRTGSRAANPAAEAARAAEQK
jgi:pimeloyl-ACP methyl ester carboxylesterase